MTTGDGLRSTRAFYRPERRLRPVPGPREPAFVGRLRLARWLVAGLLGVAHAARWATGAETVPPDYFHPPVAVVWLEGEDAVKHTFVPGESRHCWWYPGAVSGRGMLELSAADVPPAGDFVAEYAFALPDDGLYELFFRGRFPGYQSSPIHWRIDDLAAGQHPRIGEDQNAHCLGLAVNSKMALIHLGRFQAAAGTHRLTLSVRDRVEDGPGYIAQGIDALIIARAVTATVADPQPVLAEPVPGLTYAIDPAVPAHTGHFLPGAVSVWEDHGRLEVTLLVSGGDEAFNGRLRCYYSGSSFKDLLCVVPPEEFGRPCTISFDLDKEFAGVSRADIHTLWLYTYSVWYGRPAPVTVTVQRLALLQDLTAGKPTWVRPKALPSGLPPGQTGVTTGIEPQGFVWNQVDVATAAGEDAPDQAPEAASGMPVVVQAGELMLEFSEAPGGIRHVRYRGRSLAAATHSRPLFGVRFLDGGEWSTASAGAWRRVGLGWQRTVEEGPVHCILQISPDSALAEIRISVTLTNRSSVAISDVAFGGLDGVALGGDMSDDTWIAGSRAFAPGALPEHIRLVSPQQFTHDWVCVHDAVNALHVRWEDSRPLDTRAILGRDEAGASVQLRKNPCIPPGATWRVPDLVIGADSSGNWYQAADRFSAWWHTWAEVPRLPSWFHRVGGLFVGYGVLRGDDPLAANRERLAAERQRTGLYLGHTADWLPLRTEGWYPLGYRLDEEQRRRLQKITEGLHDLQGRISLYTNPLMFSRCILDYQTWGQDLTVVAADGFPVFTEHHMRHHPMALPFPGPEWCRRFGDDIETVIVNGNPDNLYVDQFGAVPSHLDFAPQRHGHMHYGEWAACQADFVESLLKRFSPDRPDFTISMEGPNVAALQHAAFALLFYDSHRVFRYTFPRYYACVGNYDSGTVEQWLAYAREAFLTGEPVLLAFSGEEMNDDELRQVRGLVLLKQALDPELHAARYRDAVGLTLPPGAEATAFVTADHALLIPFLNATGVSGEILIDPDALGVDAAIRRVALPAEPFGVLRLP